MSEIYERLRQVLIKDKSNTPESFESFLKADITKVLAEYFVLDGKDVSLKIDTDKDGIYIISLSAKASRVIPPKLH